MAKFGIGESVYFRDSEISVSVIPCMSVTIKTDNLSGKVTGVVDCGKEETEYHVDVNMPAKDVVLKVKVKESALLSHSEYVHKVIDDMIKTAEEIRTKILDDSGPFCQETFDYTLVLKKWKPIPDRYFMGVDLGRPEVVASFQPSKEVLDSLREFARTVNVHHADGLASADGGKEETAKPMHSFFFPDFSFPMAKDIIEEYEKKFNENARNIMKGVDSAVPGGDKNGASVVDKKMSKSRCVKLLESYRAERDKVKKGRKFERCLRDSVVDEALERAIELLKE